MLRRTNGEVALEMGFREPGSPPPEPKQLAEGEKAEK